MADEVEIVNPAIAGAIQESIRDEKGRIKPGFSLNPDGKKPGTLHFKTLLLDGLKEIGAKNQRGEDILLLAKAFLKEFCAQNRLPQLTIEKDACQFMLDYKWPGNIRELKAVIERAALMAEDSRITVDDLTFVTA